MTQNADHPAVQCLLSFFAEMNAWEAEACQQEESIDWERTTEEEDRQRMATIRRRIEEIFEKYCEVGTKAERLQDQGIDYGDPPNYDSKQEAVVSVTEKPGRVVIETQRTFGLQGRKKYEVVESKGVWRLRDNPKFRLEKNPKWEPARL